MQKPLDPMLVERSETPSAAYVLRRRYGRARPVIAIASWVTVINLLLQPVAVWAGTWSSINWSGDGDLPLSSGIEYTTAVEIKSGGSTATYNTYGGVSFQQCSYTVPSSSTDYKPSGTTLGTWQLGGTGWSGIGAGTPTGIVSDYLRDNTLYGVGGSKTVTLGGLAQNTEYIFSFYAPQFAVGGDRGVSLTVGSDSSGDIKQGNGADIIRYTYSTGSGSSLTVGVSFTGSGGVMGAFTHEMVPFKYWKGGDGTWDTGTTACIGQRASESPSLRTFAAGKDVVFAATGSQTVTVNGTVSPGTMQITDGTTTFNSGTISATNFRMTGGTTTVNSTLSISGTLRATGGTMNVGANVTAGIAEFSNYTSSNFSVNTGANTLNVTSEMRLPDNHVVQGAFGVKSVSGSNIADNTADRTIVLATLDGTVTLKKAVAPTGNLQRYWSFNDSAAPWKENSGAGVSDGSAVNGIAWTSEGKFGGGMNEGIAPGAYLNLDTGTTKPSFAIGSSWTVSAWYNNISNVNDYHSLFRDASNNVLIILNSTFALGSYIPGDFKTSGHTLTETQKTGWHFIAAVGGESGANTTKFYIDGTLVGTINYKIDSTITLVGGYSGGQRFADGLDEVYAYNRALSSTEITQLMNASGIGDTVVNLQTTHISATANSTLNLGASGANHILGNVNITAGATLTVNNASKLTMGTLTIGINGANCGKLDMGTKDLTLGNGSVTKLAVTSTSPTEQAYYVAVAKAGSFTTLDGTSVTDDTGKKWNVEVRDSDGVTKNAGGPQLWLVAAPGGTVIMFK